MDEAQMIETPSQATWLARQLPRVHSWGMSGTPIGKHGLKDVQELLKFIDKTEAFTSKKTWKALTESSELLEQVLKAYCHRNNKLNVGDELILPQQTEEYIILKPSGIEKHYYNDILKKCAADIQKLDEQRAKEAAEGVEYSVSVSVPLRSWLLQLRQICCHLQVGASNRQLLGERIRSMPQVLKLLIRGVLTKMFAIQRNIHSNRIEFAFLFEFENQREKAIELYGQVLKEVKTTLSEILKDLEQLQKSKNEKSKQLTEGNVELEEESNEENDYLATLKVRFEQWKELEHRILFFIAACYHLMAFPPLERIERDDSATDISIGTRAPTHPEFVVLETSYYKEAAKVRRVILGEAEKDIHVRMSDLINQGNTFANEVKGTEKGKYKIYLPTGKYTGGIKSFTLLENLNLVSDKLNQQWDVLDEWRFTILSSVTRRLEDTEDSDQLPEGDEYEKGLKNQDEAMIYLDVYSRLLVDRKAIFSGERALNYDTTRTKKSNLEQKLETKRFEFELKLNEPCLKILIHELRNLIRKAEIPNVELELCRLALKAYSEQNEFQNKIIHKLEVEKRQITELFNLRIQYYIKLQRISDSVMASEEPVDIQLSKETIERELTNLQMKLITEQGKKRYMEHLLEEELGLCSNNLKKHDCMVCREEVVKGAMTPCGHFTCEACFKFWFSKHGKCPM